MKEIQDKKIVRAYEEQKTKTGTNTGVKTALPATAGGQPGGGPTAPAVDLLLDRDATHKVNHDLDELWQNIRNFFDDLTAKGDKREIAKGDKSNKLKFMEACQSFDFEDKGIISESNLMTAFARSRYRPLPTEYQVRELVRALEAFVGEDVNYRKILEAPVSREFYSINSIFPKIVSGCKSTQI